MGIEICDTTLRDGEQAPGIRFTAEQKVSIAEKLDALGVHEIEAGFPAVSRGEKAAVRAVARSGLHAKVSALCRIKKEDIDACIDCDVGAVNLVAPVSPLHLEHKMHATLAEMAERSISAVEYARAHGLQVALSAEDATRTDLAVLIDLYERAEEAGARRVHIADTVGVATPERMAHMVREVKRRLRGAQVLVHCHNDLGLGLANALSGLMAGADSASTTVNGIGERAGNTPLEELVMALEVLYGRQMGLRIGLLLELSRMVEEYSRVRVMDTKPIVGRNAFRHESGIHVAAVLENPLTYEPFLPEVVGQRRELVLGKHSGRRALEAVLAERGAVSERGSSAQLLDRIKEGGR